ncbi:hypothetical protein CAPTEDRAFT_101356 [Capitella teleta]|uniref:C-type lectin domain-containing protein n=1 Tax=Capitella teleta TaxID=283909 RepID=R7TGB8_CAPTE|nr:hypothetical protein CAPTEDRAFT_101356 [Capitella teleta]|eukprot:ELT90611.1 hypothetical protein CAPTEDRAFT_101356 [Capitella teleta]
MDGTDNFADWKNSYPKGNGDDNAALISSHGWTSAKISKKNRFICEADSCEGNEEPCVNAEEIGDRFFGLIREKRSFDAAEGACQALGGHLASIHSKSEENAINKYIKENGPTDVLIGGTDRASEGNWQWSDGTAFDYENWKSGEPNHQPGDGDAMMTVKSGGSGNRVWRDRSTDAPAAFLCVFDTCPPSTLI